MNVSETRTVINVGCRMKCCVCVCEREKEDTQKTPTEFDSQLIGCRVRLDYCVAMRKNAFNVLQSISSINMNNEIAWSIN